MKLLAKHKYNILYALSVAVAILTIISMYLVASNYELNERLEELVSEKADFSVSEDVSLQLGLRVSQLEERVKTLEKELGIAKESIKHTDLEWKEPEQSKLLADLKWQVVKQDFTGMWPGEIELTEESSDCSDDLPQQSLYQEGGLCQSHFWVVNPQTSEEFRTKEALHSFVGDIDSAAKAAAWINLNISNVDRDKNLNATSPKVFFLDGYYYVWVSVTNQFGCGVDIGEPKQHIYRVSKDGNITSVAMEKPREAKPGEIAVCID